MDNLERNLCVNYYSLNKLIFNRILEIIELYLDKMEKINDIDYDTAISLILVIGESYEVLRDKAKWDEIGFKAMNVIKKSIIEEKNQDLSLCGGLCNIGMATFIIYKNTGYYDKFLKSLNRLIISQVQDISRSYSNNLDELRMYHYDSLYGASGIIYYLLNFSYDNEISESIKLLLDYLINLVKYKEINKKIIPSWHIKRENLMTDEDKQKYPNGNINYSLSHGIAGPLIALSKAYKCNIKVPGQLEAIKQILCEYNKLKIKESRGTYSWPGIISLDDYIDGKFNIPNERMSWCYGNISILISIFMSADATNNMQLKKWSMDAINEIALLDIEQYMLESPIICHGYAGILLMIKTIYDEIKDEIYIEKIIELLNKLINCYDVKSKFGFKDIYRINNIVEEKEENVFLEGTSGIILVLISFVKKNTDFQKLLLL